MDYDVLGFDIAMDDLLGVDLVDCLADLFHNGRYFLLGERLQLSKVVQELSSCAHLEEDIDVALVVEEAVHFDDVGM